jgi:phosphatidate cytidylyltransferase
MIGKTPLSPISPKKTWEGTIGGAILAILVVALIAKFAFNTAWLYAIVIPAIGVIIGTIGDLAESKLKRLAGVKDSGNMMPGHGGFLDRFDSMLLATPAVWVFVQIFG